LGEPRREDEHIHRDIEERRLEADERRESFVAYAVIKWTAIVVIVIAILYFLAVFVIPLFR